MRGRGWCGRRRSCGRPRCHAPVLLLVSMLPLSTPRAVARGGGWGCCGGGGGGGGGGGSPSSSSRLPRCPSLPLVVVPSPRRCPLPSSCPLLSSSSSPLVVVPSPSSSPPVAPPFHPASSCSRRRLGVLCYWVVVVVVVAVVVVVPLLPLSPLLSSLVPVVVVPSLASRRCRRGCGPVLVVVVVAVPPLPLIVPMPALSLARRGGVLAPFLVVVGPWCSFLVVLFPPVRCCRPVVLRCTRSHPASSCSRRWSWVLRWWLCRCRWPVVFVPAFPLVVLVVAGSFPFPASSSSAVPSSLARPRRCFPPRRHLPSSSFSSSPPSSSSSFSLSLPGPALLSRCRPLPSWWRRCLGCGVGRRRSCPLSSSSRCFVAPAIHPASRCSQGWRRVLGCRRRCVVITLFQPKNKNNK